ncbi:hypothetical protein CB1_002195002 [Camelus ferus]|nr:hypothetical protein CB1_002195002 [Camelus ferus]
METRPELGLGPAYRATVPSSSSGDQTNFRVAVPSTDLNAISIRSGGPELMVEYFFGWWTQQNLRTGTRVPRVSRERGRVAEDCWRHPFTCDL